MSRRLVVSVIRDTILSLLCGMAIMRWWQLEPLTLRLLAAVAVIVVCWCFFYAERQFRAYRQKRRGYPVTKR
jgi:Na+/glutamate symporter